MRDEPKQTGTNDPRPLYVAQRAVPNALSLPMADALTRFADLVEEQEFVIREEQRRGIEAMDEW